MGIGGSYGRGAIVCAPVRISPVRGVRRRCFALEGANIGFQLGGQATDFVLLVMNPRGAESILNSKVKLGGDASAAAGPKGRTAAARPIFVNEGRNPDVFPGRGDSLPAYPSKARTLRQDNARMKTSTAGN